MTVDLSLNSQRADQHYLPTFVRGNRAHSDRVACSISQRSWAVILMETTEIPSATERTLRAKRAYHQVVVREDIRVPLTLEIVANGHFFRDFIDGL